MRTIKCSKCRAKGPVLSNGYCRECMRLYNATPGARAARRARTQEVRADNARHFEKYVSRSVCTDCDEGDVLVLELDLAVEPDVVHRSVSYMLRNFSWEKIRRVLDACEIVCAPCLRRRKKLRCCSH